MVPKKLLAATVGIVAVVGVAVIVLTNQSAPEATNTKPSTFTMRGSVRINKTVGDPPFSTKGVACQGAGGYSDITPGTAVIVQDATGHTVGTGALQVGYPATTTINDPGFGDKPLAYVYACSLSFLVPDVPDGLSSYSVTVSHRGTQVVRGASVHDDVDLVLNSGK